MTVGSSKIFMKEIRLQELLNMADPAAHDSICDLWNQKTIHFLVIFTSPDQDFEIIGAGPSLPCTTLEAATTHSIPNKTPEFYVKCPAAIASRLQPRLAPSPARSNTRPPNVPEPVPTLKGRTVAPFIRPALKMPTKPTSPEQGTGSTKNVAPPLPTAPIVIAPDIPPASPTPPAPIIIEPAKPAAVPSLEERERAIARREHELATLAASLKIREAALRDREAALAASEDRLLNPPKAD